MLLHKLFCLPLIGHYEVFFKSGGLSEIGTYHENILDGEIKIYNEDGVMVKQLLYEKGIEKRSSL